jgi:hypothetical protein
VPPLANSCNLCQYWWVSVSVSKMISNPGSVVSVVLPENKDNRQHISSIKKIYDNERLSPYVFLRLSTVSILIPALRQRSARQLESTVLQQVRANIR